MVWNSTGRSQKEPQVRDTKGQLHLLLQSRAESWTGRCCETTPQNLSQGHSSQCCFLLLQIIPHLELSSCLPHPGGNSQPFLLSFCAPHLTILLSGVSVVALAPISSSYVQVWVVPAPQPLGACPAALGLCPALAVSLEWQVETRALQQCF